MTITKSSLINAICNNSNVPKQESTSAVESLLEIIKKLGIRGRCPDQRLREILFEG